VVFLIGSLCSLNLSKSILDSRCRRNLWACQHADRAMPHQHSIPILGYCKKKCVKFKKSDFCVGTKNAEKMNFTQEQISELFDEIANKKEGYQQLLKMSLEAIMRAESEQFNIHNKDNL
jgi:hypothetical protein